MRLLVQYEIMMIMMIMIKLVSCDNIDARDDTSTHFRWVATMCVVLLKAAIVQR